MCSKLGLQICIPDGNHAETAASSKLHRLRVYSLLTEHQISSLLFRESVNLKAISVNLKAISLPK